MDEKEIMKIKVENDGLRQEYERLEEKVTELRKQKSEAESQKYRYKTAFEMLVKQLREGK